MAGSSGGMGSSGSGGVVSGGFLRKKTVKDVMKPDKKSTKKFAQRKRGY